MCIRDSPSGDRSDLIDYLTQLDGRDANGVALAAPTAPSPQAPGIVSEPQSLTLAEGNALNFVVAVSGTGPFTDEWRRCSTVVGTNRAEFQIASGSTDPAGRPPRTLPNTHGHDLTTPRAPPASRGSRLASQAGAPCSATARSLRSPRGPGRGQAGRFHSSH